MLIAVTFSANHIARASPSTTARARQPQCSRSAVTAAVISALLRPRAWRSRCRERRSARGADRPVLSVQSHACIPPWRAFRKRLLLAFNIFPGCFAPWPQPPGAPAQSSAFIAMPIALPVPPIALDVSSRSARAWLVLGAALAATVLLLTDM
jgi:hypothetical protein